MSVTSIETPAREIANTIRKQIGFGTLATLGAHNFRHGNIVSATAGVALPSLVFNARILPFNAKGKRLSGARVMLVVVSLNGADLYDITVSHNQAGDRYGLKGPVTHFQATDIHAEDLARTLFALDYDGETALNPRIA